MEEVVKRENYIVIQGWMLTELKLKGNDLLVYACIYGFSQDSNTFKGSLQYLASWTNSTIRGVSKNLDSLIAKGLLQKESYRDEKGVLRCEYRALIPAKDISVGIEHSSIGYRTEFYEGIEHSSMRYRTEFQGGIELSSNNNIYNNIKDNIKDNIYKQIVCMYNDTCVSFPKVSKLSEARKKAIKARMNTATIEDFKILFEKAQASDFLKGKNNRNWMANFDWLIKDSNMAKVLDGNYDNKAGSFQNGTTTRVSAGNYDDTTRQQMKELEKAREEKQSIMASDEYSYLDDLEALGLR